MKSFLQCFKGIKSAGVHVFEMIFFDEIGKIFMKTFPGIRESGGRGKSCTCTNYNSISSFEFQLACLDFRRKRQRRSQSERCRIFRNSMKLRWYSMFLKRAMTKSTGSYWDSIERLKNKIKTKVFCKYHFERSYSGWCRCTSISMPSVPPVFQRDKIRRSTCLWNDIFRWNRHMSFTRSDRSFREN
mgnify:CR=1 FL=1